MTPVSSADQLTPTILPSTTSMLFAWGSLGKPGIRTISPHTATIKPAPLLITRSSTSILKSPSSPLMAGLCKTVLCFRHAYGQVFEAERLIFSMLPALSYTAPRLYHRRWLLRSCGSWFRYRRRVVGMLQRGGRFSQMSTTACAISTAPAPPWLNDWLTAK